MIHQSFTNSMQEILSYSQLSSTTTNYYKHVATQFGVSAVFYTFELTDLCRGPEQTLSFPGGLVSQISRQSAHEGSKVVSPTHQPPLPAAIFLTRISVKNLSRPQGHSMAGRIMSMKLMTPTGIEPATFQLVAHWLNQLRHFWVENCGVGFAPVPSWS